MYSPPPLGEPDPFNINTCCRASVGAMIPGIGGSTFTSTAWVAASRAYFVPFTIAEKHNYVRACVANGATASGNFDLGVYQGTSRLFSTGATGQSGTSQMQKVTVDWTLDPGDYYLALVFDNITATVFASPPTSAILNCCGMKQMSTAYALPDTATFANMASGFFPLFGISEKSWI